MEYVINTENELTNTKNNIESLVSHCTLSYQNDFIISTKEYYTYFKKRLDSALKSMLSLYQNTDIDYTEFNGYLLRHQRVINQLITMVSTSDYREIRATDGEFSRLMLRLDDLNDSYQRLEVVN